MNPPRSTLVEKEHASQSDPDVPSGEPVLSTADLAECTCPDFCERDHGNE